jgi:hypothetical protein
MYKPLCLLVGLMVQAFNPQSKLLTENVLVPVGQISLKVQSFSGSNLREVTYYYEFPERDFVYISRIGLAPAKGIVTVLERDFELQFLDPKTKKSLDARVVARDQPPIDEPHVPEEKEFPVVARQVEWKFKSNPQLAALKACSDLGLLCEPYEREQRFYLRTALVDLKQPLKNRRARIALLLSQPYRLGNRVFVRVQHLLKVFRLRESEPISTRSVDAMITKSATATVDALVQKMIEEGRSAH